MQLNNPGAIESAIEAVKSLQFQLESARSAKSAEGKRDNFVNWCEERARGIFEHLFARSEDIFDELEAVYIRVSLADLSEARLYSLVTREFTRWSQNLSRIEAELLDQQRALGIPGHRIVLDTSVLMECEPPFTTFDWPSVHPEVATGNIRLIVPIIAIDELDELLHSPNGERRRKARDATRRLRDVHPNNKPTEAAPLPGKPDVTLEIFMDPPWRVRLPNNDAEVIDQALQLHQVSGFALLGTCDTRMYYRAGAVDLPVVLLPRKDLESTAAAS